jgi:hypothetical protein
METVSATDRVRNEQAVHKVREEVNILRTVKNGRLPGLVASCAGTAF